MPEAVSAFGSQELDLVRHLNRRGWEATLLTTGGRGRYRHANIPQEDGGPSGQLGEFRSLRSQEALGISFPIGVAHAFDELQPELVHLHSEDQLVSLAAAHWAKRRHVPLLVTTERYAPPAHLVTRILYELFGRPISRSVSERAVGWTTHTTAARIYLEGWRGQGSPVEVIPTAVDCARLGFGDSAAGRRLLEAAEEGRLILSVGRLVPYKGYDDLVEAASHLIRARPDLQFRVVGQGPSHASLAQKIDRLGLSSHFRIIADPVPPAQMPDLYAGADLYVQPSRTEPFGRALVEALAAGCPVVATKLGGFLDTVPPDAGRLVTPGDPHELARGILELLNEASASLRVRAQAWARERFDWEVVLPRYEALYAAHSVRGARR